MHHHNLWRERGHSGGPSPVCLRGNRLDPRRVCLWPWLEHKAGREHSVRLVGCARERPLGAPLRPACPPSDWPRVPAWNLRSGENGCCPLFSEKTVTSPACHGGSSTVAAGRGLYRDSRPSGERNKLQAVPEACPLNFHVQFSSLTTGQYFGRSGLLKWWSSPTFTPKRTVFFVFSFLLFFFGRVIVVHIYPMARGAWQALIHSVAKSWP